jgi:predicted dehydrogenase
MRSTSVRLLHTNNDEFVHPVTGGLSHVGTPHTLHYSNAVGAIKAGKHVLVEKPATTNAEDFRLLAALAKAHGVFLMEAMWTRFQPISQSIRGIIDQGSLGAPVMVHADLSFDFDIESELSFVILSDASSIRGFLILNLIEDIPLTHRILDPKLGGGAILDL